MQALLTEIAPQELSRAAALLGKAEAVYLIGQLRSAPIVELLRYVLTMLGNHRDFGQHAFTVGEEFGRFLRRA